MAQNATPPPKQSTKSEELWSALTLLSGLVVVFVVIRDYAGMYGTFDVLTGSGVAMPQGRPPGSA